MENLVKHIQSGQLEAEAVMLLCDKAEAGAITRAKTLGISVVVMDRKSFPSAAVFEEMIMKFINQNHIDWIILAGFMRILSPEFVRRYEGRIINIHPSYLPAFPGAHAIRDAFEAKVQETGVTVHFVTPEVDAGPVILQRKVQVLPEETLETLEAKVHAVEYKIYPEALRLVLSGQAVYPKK